MPRTTSYFSSPSNLLVASSAKFTDIVRVFRVASCLRRLHSRVLLQERCPCSGKAWLSLRLRAYYSLPPDQTLQFSMHTDFKIYQLIRAALHVLASVMRVL